VSFTLPVYGKLNAHDRIQIFAEVNGILQPTNKKFLEGVTYAKGERLLQIDKTEAMANLMAQRSNYLNSISGVLPDLKIDYPKDFSDWQNYLENLDIESSAPAPPKASSKKSDLYLTARGVYSSYYNLKSAEARLDKYEIRAPFAGVVVQSNIRQGTLVRPGQLLGEFISAGRYELETSISLRFVPFINVGNTVNLKSADVPGVWQGKIERINEVIDEATQTVKVYIEVTGSDLREGMYLEGSLEGLQIEDAFAVSRRFLVDNNHLFVVKQDSILQKTAVEIVEYTEDQAIVRGLTTGTDIVVEVLPGATSGTVVRQNKQAANN
jgi:multidrug efflux pump subunit AcrA (membrane-fusion protein)